MHMYVNEFLKSVYMLYKKFICVYMLFKSIVILNDIFILA